MSCNTQISLFNDECKPFIQRYINPFIGMVVVYENINYKCIKLRDSGICTFVGVDEKGELLPSLKNDKGNIIDYRVRLIKFNKP